MGCANLKCLVFQLLTCLTRNVPVFFFSTQEYGHQASHYHGNMEPFDRAEVQRRWSRDKINIICATVAFGMGNVIQRSLNSLFICVPC